MENTIISPRMRVVNKPSLGAYDLVTGRGPSLGQYARSGSAFACMQIRATELANLPWRLVRGEKVVEKHPLIEVLEAFTTEDNWSDALIATEINQLMVGAAYWVYDVDRLQRLDPNTIEVLTSRAGITGFKQTIKGKVVNTFKRDEIVYFRNYNPNSDLLPGPSEMKVAKAYVDLEYEAVQYLTAFFRNDATPNLLLSTDKELPQKEMERRLKWWNLKFRGRTKRHQVAMADAGLKATQLSSTLKEMALKELRDQARQDICAVFRVPEVLLQMSGATYANALEARKFLIEDLIIPRSKYYADVINSDLVSLIDPNITFEFVPEDLPILQEDSTAKAERLNAMLEKRVISPEYYREAMGIPESAAPKEQSTPETNTRRAWYRKAARAFKAGKTANVPFETDKIAVETQDAIRAKLETAETLEDVKEALA